MKIRTVIVDDEAPARSRLRRLLAPEADLEIIAEAGNGDDAIRLIGEERPDLLFLDVQMPAPDGLAVLRAVRGEWLPCTIFTTAFAEHAVTAFELHALDYLLKPYSAERLQSAVARARQHLRGAPVPAGDPRLAALVEDPAIAVAPVERFLVKAHERYIVVRAGDITWVEAAANYVILHTAAGNHILRRAIGALETELDAARFFRASRSAIVNLSLIREVEAAGAGEHTIVLLDGTRVLLTRGLRELQERLKSIA